ncbi:MAG: polyribonucleotide nucleotidyltransferase [Chlamydiota bacterium]
MDKKSITIKIGDTDVTFETGVIARQAGGAVVVKAEDTMVFSTACASAEPLKDVDFMPLRVDYQEKFSSAGKTLGGFIKREGRPSEKEILTSRLIDRPIRPMFAEGYYHDTQILSYVWSYDGEHQPDVLAICAASAALTISEIPLIKPIGAVRVGMIDGKFVINPSVSAQENSKLDLILAGTEDGILMIEGFAGFLSEEQVLEAIDCGHAAIKNICHSLAEWGKEIGKPKISETLTPLSDDIFEEVKKIAQEELSQAFRIFEKDKREAAISIIKEKVLAELLPEDEEPRFKELDIKKAFKKLSAKCCRKMIIEENTRPDGRSTTEIRPITIEQSLLPRTHGSSLFTRGETQSLAICTLGGEHMAQRFEDLEGEGSRKFYLQYFFPPFSVGEVGRSGPPGRREIGHGKLAERALKEIIPEYDKFPYTIRLESNITESNGSSSMASVCGGCLAMMDAGIPIERPVAGIAMGLVLEDDKATILSDILGVEDALGDMDFKITGDKEGITAFQMDIKVEGITPEIMKAALFQAKEGRIHILDKMLAACPKSKEEMSQYAPRIATISIAPSKIGTVIGPGGKQIRAIVEETGVDIDIDDDGTVFIASKDPAMMKRAQEIVNNLVAEPEIGKTYKGKVVSIVPFGAFVEILPGKEGLCHISELDSTRVEKVEDILKEGEEINVKLLDINDRGQLRLSRKATFDN